MRPTGPEIKEACVALVGVTEAGGGHFMAEPLPAAGAAEEPHDGRTNGSVAVSATYAVHPDGSLAVNWTLDAGDAMPAAIPWGFKSLPRAGVHVALPGDLAAAAWYGRGPHECYADRLSSAKLGVHEAAVEDLHVPYIYPGRWKEGGERERGRPGGRPLLLNPIHPSYPLHSGECGGRSGVRWLALTGGASGGVLAAATAAPVQATVSRFPLASLAAASHDHELTPDGATHVTLDAAHMGVGGDDSWSPSVWERYAVPPAAYTLGLVLAPVAPGEDAGAAAAKRWLAGR
jgi:beta-galactosidase